MGKKKKVSLNIFSLKMALNAEIAITIIKKKN